jgi:hypothetical protein
VRVPPIRITAQTFTEEAALRANISETGADSGAASQPEIPNEEFESQFGKGKRPTTSGLVREQREKAKPKPDPELLHKQSFRRWWRLHDLLF